MQIYLVGRRNSSQPCDIEVPSSAVSVSRKHLELSVTDDGRCYLVHLHPRNVTAVYRSGGWRNLTQDYVEWDEPIRLGEYETTARELIACGGGAESLAEAPVRAERESGAIEWDPECGTFRGRARQANPGN